MLQYGCGVLFVSLKQQFTLFVPSFFWIPGLFFFFSLTFVDCVSTLSIKEMSALPYATNRFPTSSFYYIFNH